MCSVETNDAMEVNADEGSNVSQFTFKDVENAFLEIVKLHTLPFTGNNVDGEVINIFKSTKNNNVSISIFCGVSIINLNLLGII